MERTVGSFADTIKGWPPEYGMVFGTRLKSGQMSYTWVGGPVIELSMEHLLHIGQYAVITKFLVIGPYRLRILTLGGPQILAVKITPLFSSDSLLASKFRLKRWLKSLNRKMLHTLAIWEVIPHEPGALPEWRDLFRRKKADDG